MNKKTKHSKPKMQQEDGVKYYMSGQMYKKMTYKEGKLDGPWEQFYQNGQVHYEGEFKDGRPEGFITM